ncbi:MAG: homoserine O-acetyltransferase family protein [Methyloligellaceae bacterium]
MLLPTSRTFSSGPLTLREGGTLPELTIAYETYGTLASDKSNTVLLCHGYSNHPHAAGDDDGWWNALIGPGRAIDTDRYFVVCANMLGSAFGSTGPASINPDTGTPYGPDFPAITVPDMVAAQERLLEHLGVGDLAAVIGYSFGGYLTFHWGISQPGRMRALVPVATAMTGRGAQDDIAALTERFAKCPGWNEGNYYADKKDGGVWDALVQWRIETLRNYGVARRLADRLGNAADAEAELQRMARQWADAFDAHSLIVLRRASGGFDARGALAAIKAPVLYVLASTDKLFPPEIAPATMARLGEAGVDARYHQIDSDYGHNAPSADWQKWAGALEAFLREHAG